MKPILCRIGAHAWRHAFGTFNRYFECQRCGKRRVALGLGGYQPVAWWWLKGLPEPKRTPPNQGSSGVPRARAMQ